MLSDHHHPPAPRAARPRLPRSPSLFYNRRTEGIRDIVPAARPPQSDPVAFTAHLEELRNRLLIVLTAVALGMVVGWVLYPVAYGLVAGPILEAIRAQGGLVMTRQPAEAFFTQLKLATALGVALASPVAIYQLWAFVRPGLTPQERRLAAPLVPAVSGLFLLGVALARLFFPPMMAFLTGFTPAGVVPNLDYQESILFPLKVMLAFGLAFQVPVVLLGLVALGILTPGQLLTHWRTAVVALSVVAAVVTPTGDPMSLMLLLVPLLLLYFGTILVARRLVRPRAAAHGEGA
jgi:sec-independent protein translocase protein TatC